jgi:hypothetical protein
VNDHFTAKRSVAQSVARLILADSIQVQLPAWPVVVVSVTIFSKMSTLCGSSNRCYYLDGYVYDTVSQTVNRTLNVSSSS